MIPQLKFNATEPVRAAIAGLGRTEDIRFSPDGRLLVLAGFIRKRCLILRVQVEPTCDGPLVTMDDFMELTSDGISAVHGIDFIDDQTLAIANRDAKVSVVQLPSGELAGRHCHVAATTNVRGTVFCRVKWPGSIAARRDPDGRVSLLVCNNYLNQVSRHVIDVQSGYRVTKNRLLLHRGLKIPDGIAVSHDGKWMAVSGHHTHDVKLFDASKPLGRLSKPSAILRNANFPHGVRFTADDRHVLVADAGSPVINVYDRGATWEGSRDPSRTVVVLDDETFARGRISFEEGGPKGIDIDPSGTVLAVTCEEQPLAFFSLSSITNG